MGLPLNFAEMLPLSSHLFCLRIALFLSFSTGVLYRGVSQPTVSAKCDFPTEGQINVSVMGSGSIRPDGFVLKNANECFDSLRSHAC